MIESIPVPAAVNGDSGPNPLERHVLAERLRACGLRVTTSRLALLAILSKAAGPTTIDQLFGSAGSTTCDLVTIYRTMAAFERAGVVYRSGFSERGAVLYNINAGVKRRYPVIRKGTSVIDELDNESSAELQVTIDRIKHRLLARGYKGLEHIVEFFAVSPPPGVGPEAI